MGPSKAAALAVLHLQQQLKLAETKLAEVQVAPVLCAPRLSAPAG